MSAFGRGTRSLVPRRVLVFERRSYATATRIPRPPPPTEEPPTETFSAPSKPKLYYTRPSLRDDLPQIQVPPSIRLPSYKKLKLHLCRNDGHLFSHLLHLGCPDGPPSFS